MVWSEGAAGEGAAGEGAAGEGAAGEGAARRQRGIGGSARTHSKPLPSMLASTLPRLHPSHGTWKGAPVRQRTSIRSTHP